MQLMLERKLTRTRTWLTLSVYGFKKVSTYLRSRVIICVSRRISFRTSGAKIRHGHSDEVFCLHELSIFQPVDLRGQQKRVNRYAESLTWVLYVLWIIQETTPRTGHSFPLFYLCCFPNNRTRP